MQVLTDNFGNVSARYAVRGFKPAPGLWRDLCPQVTKVERHVRIPLHMKGSDGMDISQFGALIQGAQAAAQLIRGAVDVRDDAKLTEAQAQLNKALSEAYGAVLAVQAQMLGQYEKLTAVTQEVAVLNKRIAEFDERKLNASRYELFEFTGGGKALRIKPEAQGAEPLHYLCQPCYDNGASIVLQPRKSAAGSFQLCPRCKNEYRDGEVRQTGRIVRQPGGFI